MIMLVGGSYLGDLMIFLEDYRFRCQWNIGFLRVNGIKKVLVAETKVVVEIPSWPEPSFNR